MSPKGEGLMPPDIPPSIGGCPCQPDLVFLFIILLNYQINAKNNLSLEEKTGHYIALLPLLT